jgi:hypothetical protein
MLSRGLAGSWRHSCSRCLPHMQSCTHSEVARAHQQRAQHPRGIQGSQCRPSRWQGARQLVVVKEPAFRRGGAQHTGRMSFAATPGVCVLRKQLALF